MILPQWLGTHRSTQPQARAPGASSKPGNGQRTAGRHADALALRPAPARTELTGPRPAAPRVQSPKCLHRSTSHYRNHDHREFPVRWRHADQQPNHPARKPTCRSGQAAAEAARGGRGGRHQPGPGYSDQQITWNRRGSLTSSEQARRACQRPQGHAHPLPRPVSGQLGGKPRRRNHLVSRAPPSSG